MILKRLEKHSYHQNVKTPGFWKHDTRPINFILLVDDYGVKHIGKEDADHLINVLEEHYEVAKD